MVAGIAALEALRGTNRVNPHPDPLPSKGEGTGERQPRYEDARLKAIAPQSLLSPSKRGEDQREGIARGREAYTRLEQLGAQLEAGMKDAAKAAKVPVRFNRCGSMFCAYFTERPVHNLADAMHSDRERFKSFFHAMLAAGVYLAPSQFEAGFLSTAHTEADIEKTVDAAAKLIRNLRLSSPALGHRNTKERFVAPIAL